MSDLSSLSKEEREFADMIERANFKQFSEDTAIVNRITAEVTAKVTAEVTAEVTAGERAKAEAEKLEEKLEIARSLLTAGMPITNIANHIKLSVEVIKNALQGE